MPAGGRRAAYRFIGLNCQRNANLTFILFARMSPFIEIAVRVNPLERVRLAFRFSVTHTLNRKRKGKVTVPFLVVLQRLAVAVSAKIK